jgi:undecaprenyl-diphosphatase
MRKPRRELIVLAAVGSAATIGRLAATGKTRGLDRGCRRQMKRVHTNSLSRAAKVATAFGEPAAQLSLASLVGLALARRSALRENRHRDARGARIAAASPLVATLTAIATHHAIKLVFKRRRPGGALIRGKTEPSFPSGHASVTTATVGASVYALIRHDIVPANAAPFAAGLPLAVGLSRVYLDKHWASDVIGGWLVGVGIAAGASSLYDTATNSSTQKRSHRQQ